jgi:hypothetical protein
MVVQEFWQPFSESAEAMEICCAWCGRYRNPDDSWSEPSTRRSFRFASHGICPACVEEMQRLDEPEVSN